MAKLTPGRPKVVSSIGRIQDTYTKTSLTDILRTLDDLNLTIAKVINTNAAEGTWTEPSLVNSWVNYTGGWPNAAYMSAGDGFVIIRGLIKSGTLNAAAFTLPVGFRPTVHQMFATASNAGHAELRVYADGTVVPYAGGTGYFSLNCFFYIGS